MIFILSFVILEGISLFSSGFLIDNRCLYDGTEIQKLWDTSTILSIDFYVFWESQQLATNPLRIKLGDREFVFVRERPPQKEGPPKEVPPLSEDIFPESFILCGWNELILRYSFGENRVAMTGKGGQVWYSSNITLPGRVPVRIFGGFALVNCHSLDRFYLVSKANATIPYVLYKQVDGIYLQSKTGSFEVDFTMGTRCKACEESTGEGVVYHAMRQTCQTFHQTKFEPIKEYVLYTYPDVFDTRKSLRFGDLLFTGVTFHKLGGSDFYVKVSSHSEKGKVLYKDAIKHSEGKDSAFNIPVQCNPTDGRPDPDENGKRTAVVEVPPGTMTPTTTTVPSHTTSQPSSPVTFGTVNILTNTSPKFSPQPSTNIFGLDRTFSTSNPRPSNQDSSTTIYALVGAGAVIMIVVGIGVAAYCIYKLLMRKVKNQLQEIKNPDSEKEREVDKNFYTNETNVDRRKANGLQTFYTNDLKMDNLPPRVITTRSGAEVGPKWKSNRELYSTKSPNYYESENYYEKEEDQSWFGRYADNENFYEKPEY